MIDEIRTAPAPSVGAAARLLFAVAVFAAAAGVTGCGPSAPLGRAGADLTPPAGWSPAPADRWAVPGTPVAAWAGPGGASLVAYRGLPIPGGGGAEQFGASLANRLDNLPGIVVPGRSTVQAAGREAARVEAVGPGTGDRFAPSGAGQPYAPEGVAIVPTRRVVVAIPRSTDVFILAWHAPEADAAALNAAVDATLATLRLSDAGPAPAGGY